ncbi:unnamed protein product [Didymodactylos carnosus]|nr:unnamed protein product [Didymodactylos carnosus]CAF3702452.1 unnamed protein product [Didymodactylos carnosus]
MNRYPSSQVASPEELLFRLIQRQQGIRESIAEYYEKKNQLCHEYDICVTDQQRIYYLKQGLGVELKQYAEYHSFVSLAQFKNVMEIHERHQLQT